MKIQNKILAAFAAVTISAVAFAADASPAGNWKWSQQGRNGPQEYTAKLDVKDGKVMGAVTGGGGGQAAPAPADIGDATFKDGAITFTVTREFNGNKRVTKYSGKLEGDMIKGTIMAPGRGGAEPMPVDWVATRVK